MKKYSWVFVVSIIIAVGTVIFLAFFVFDNFIGASADTLKNGGELFLARPVKVNDYFKDLYVNNLATSISNGYEILFENENNLYYGKECVFNNKRVCHFKKISKNSLDSSFSAWKLSGSVDLYSKALGEFFEKNKKENFDVKSCKFVSGSNDSDTSLKNGEIIKIGTNTEKCETGGSAITTYKLILSANDFSVIDSSWDVKKQ